MNILAKIKYFIIDQLYPNEFKSKIDNNYTIKIHIINLTHQELKRIIIFIKYKNNDYIKICTTKYSIFISNRRIKKDISLNLFIIYKYNKITKESGFYE